MGASSPRPARGFAVGRVPAVALAPAALAALAWGSSRARPEAPSPVKRFTLDFGGAPPLAGVAGSSLALSPDDAHLAYVGNVPEGRQLFPRPFDRLEAAPIPNTVGAREPFFSPDGDWRKTSNQPARPTADHPWRNSKIGRGPRGFTPGKVKARST